MNNSPTRRAEPAEQTPVLTPLPPPRVPLIAYADHIESLPPQAFSSSELGKLHVHPDPLIDWHIVGTNLEATVSYRERTYQVKCQTTMADECIESWPVSIFWLEAVEFVRGGGPYVVTDGQHFKERHLLQSEHEGLFRALHESAGEFLYYRSPTLIAAHAAERDDLRAESVRDEEGMYA